jgi:hypothetical protein
VPAVVAAVLATGVAVIWWLVTRFERGDRGERGASRWGFRVFAALAVALWAVTLIDLL